MQIVIFITALILFAFGVLLGFEDKVTAATATYGAAVLSLIFSFLPKFKKFKGLGIEAELLDKKIEEADTLLSQLRDVSIPIAEMVLSSTARMGRWDSGMPRNKKHDLVQRMERELRKVGVSDTQLDLAKEDWHYYNIFDLSSPVFGTITEALQRHLSEREHVLSQFSQPITPEHKSEYEQLVENRNIALKEVQGLKDLQQLKNQSELPTLLTESVSNSKLLSGDEKISLASNIEEQIKDIDHYVKHKEFRRLSVWLSENDS